MKPGPVTDSRNLDAFEAAVELYFQANGYVTSSGKRFWVWKTGEKKRRKSQESIDVLAINERETVLVKVCRNSDGPLRFGTYDLGNLQKLRAAEAYFGRVTQYLESVEQYAWMVAENRRIRKVVAYSGEFKDASGLDTHLFGRQGFEVLSAKALLGFLGDYVGQPHLDVQDQIMGTLQIIRRSGIAWKEGQKAKDQGEVPEFLRKWPDRVVPDDEST